jgi:hypothetical protein
MAVWRSLEAGQAYRAWVELLSETLTLLDETIDELEEPPLAVTWRWTQRMLRRVQLSPDSLLVVQPG